MATPEIVLGASMLTLFVATALPPLQGSVPTLYPTGFTTILIAHIMFNISFVVVTVKARLAGFDRHLEEAAMDLGANELTTFWKVTFPLILPGILAAALLAFSLSIDDFVITNFRLRDDQHVPDLDLRRVIRNALPAADQRHRHDHLPRRRRPGRDLDARSRRRISGRAIAASTHPLDLRSRPWSTRANRPSPGRRHCPPRPRRRAARSGAGSRTSMSTAARGRG